MIPKIGSPDGRTTTTAAAIYPPKSPTALHIARMLPAQGWFTILLARNIVDLWLNEVDEALTFAIEGKLKFSTAMTVPS